MVNEYLIKKESLTKIADEVRELSGTSQPLGLDAMASNLVEANTEIDSQVELLAQAVAALEGKAAGGVDTSIEDSLITGDIISYTNNRVSNIAQYAFAANKVIQDVSFPVAIAIGSNAFYECSNLTIASFPVVTTIGSNAFKNCFNLTSISFPVATTIGSSTFYDCSKLTTASFPVATTIGDYAFGYCSNLTTISFPAVTIIGSSAFYGCSKLTTASFPVATTIGDYAFFRCPSLTTASFPVATTISSSAFKNCFNLTSISFPVATTIGSYTFYCCSKLTTISFPVVTTIDPFAFFGCSNLTSIVLAGQKIPNLKYSDAFAQISATKTFYVPSSMIQAYQSATNWAYYSRYFSAIENYSGWDGNYGIF